MAVFSQNGFLANDTDVLAWTTVPGTGARFRLCKGPVTTVLLYLASRFDDEVEDIDTAGSFIADAKPSIPGGEPSTLLDDWSYAPRPIRGSTTTLSNHASGTAIDLNATQHPRGVRGTFTAAQVRAVRAILADLRDPTTGRCVVRWGEDYKTAPVDGMHFEINADASAVARVAARLEDDMPTANEVALANWRFKNERLEDDDAYSILRQTRNAAKATLAHAASTDAAMQQLLKAGTGAVDIAAVQKAAQDGAEAALRAVAADVADGTD